MEPRDFLYRYTTIFFSEVVKETILIENWEESDFDHRYVEYADIFLEIKKECSVKGLSGEDILNILTQHKQRIVDLFNERMEKHFINEFGKHGSGKQEIKRSFFKNLFYNDKINGNVLKTFRNIEERHFTK